MVSSLIDTWDDSRTDNLLVLLPVLAILAMAFDIITTIPVNEEDGEIDDVKVRDRDGPSRRITLDNLTPILHYVRSLGVGASGQDLVTCQAGRQAVRPGL